MKKVFFILIIITASLSFLSAGNERIINFTVNASQEVEADFLVLNLKIEKKDKDISRLLNNINDTVKKIESELLNLGLDKENILMRKFNTVPDLKLWSKEYKIISFMELKVDQPVILNKIMKKLNDIDSSIIIDKLSFRIKPDNYEKIKIDLIEIASKKAEKIKQKFEESYSIKLKLKSINHSETQFMPEGPPGIDNNIPPLYNTAALYDESFYAGGMLTPLLKIEIIQYFNYMILD